MPMGYGENAGLEYAMKTGVDMLVLWGSSVDNRLAKVRPVTHRYVEVRIINFVISPVFKILQKCTKVPNYIILYKSMMLSPTTYI